MCSSADGGAAALPVDVLVSLLSALQQSALAFAAAAAALGGAGAGPSLRKEARRLAAGVVEPCIGLLRALVRLASGDFGHTRNLPNSTAIATYHLFHSRLRCSICRF